MFCAHFDSLPPPAARKKFAPMPAPQMFTEYGSEGLVSSWTVFSSSVKAQSEGAVFEHGILQEVGQTVEL